MTTKSDEEQIHTILENLYYAGVEHDTIEVTGGGDNQERAIAKAASKVQAMLTEARIDQVEKSLNLIAEYKLNIFHEYKWQVKNELFTDIFDALMEELATLSNQTEQKGA